MPTQPTSGLPGRPSTTPDLAPTADDIVRTLVLRLAALALAGLVMPTYLRIDHSHGYADLAFDHVEDLRAWAAALGVAEVRTFTYVRERDGVTERVASTNVDVLIGPGTTIYLTHRRYEPADDAPQVAS